jgi:hypothetical protein
MNILARHGDLNPVSQRVLVTRGGVGGEGAFLVNNYGFHDVTVADMSENALENCRRFDPRLKTRRLDPTLIRLVRTLAGVADLC